MAGPESLANFAGWLLSASAGFFLREVLKHYPKPFLWIRERSARDSANRAAALRNEITRPLRLLQAPTSRRFFQEDSDEVRLVVDDDYTPPRVVRDEIRNVHEKQWIQDEFENETQIGLRQVSILRRTDAALPKADVPEIQVSINGRSYEYFDALATNLRLNRGSAADKALLWSFARRRHRRAQGHLAIEEFANPLSVGLSLFCERGDWLVLSRRTYSLAGGGHLAAGRTFNAVGENVNERDGHPNGNRRYCPWRTARRGLSEEMGLLPEDLKDTQVHLHSLAWDSEFFDHKFFGLAMVDMPRGTVLQRWEKAPDRRESASIDFALVRTRNDARLFIRGMLAARKQWAREAIFSTIESLILMDRIRIEDLSLD
jgi:hypothetical protein